MCIIILKRGFKYERNQALYVNHYAKAAQRFIYQIFKPSIHFPTHKADLRFHKIRLQNYKLLFFIQN